MIDATISPALAEPRAAPNTPMPAPGIVIEQPIMDNSRVGKIKKKLKMTSRTHINILSWLGTRIFPLQRNMELATKSIIKNGTNSMKVPKYNVACARM